MSKDKVTQVDQKQHEHSATMVQSYKRFRMWTRKESRHVALVQFYNRQTSKYYHYENRCESLNSSSKKKHKLFFHRCTTLHLKTIKKTPFVTGKLTGCCSLYKPSSILADCTMMDGKPWDRNTFKKTKNKKRYSSVCLSVHLSC